MLIISNCAFMLYTFCLISQQKQMNKNIGIIRYAIVWPIPIPIIKWKKNFFFPETIYLISLSSLMTSDKWGSSLLCFHIHNISSKMLEKDKGFHYFLDFIWKLSCIKRSQEPFANWSQKVGHDSAPHSLDGVSLINKAEALMERPLSATAVNGLLAFHFKGLRIEGLTQERTWKTN